MSDSDSSCDSLDEDLNSELMSSVDSGVYNQHFGGKFEKIGKLIRKSTVQGWGIKNCEGASVADEYMKSRRYGLSSDHDDMVSMRSDSLFSDRFA